MSSASGRLGLTAYPLVFRGSSSDWGSVIDRLLEDTFMHIIGVLFKTFRRISEFASVGGNDLSSNAAAPGKPAADPVYRATTLVPVALRLRLFF